MAPPPPPAVITTAQQLKDLIDTHPLIDNHAHPLLQPAGQADDSHPHHPLESIVSEATGDALLQTSPFSLAHLRAVRQLAALLGCQPTWAAVKRARSALDERQLCRWQSTCFDGIQCMLLDDGLGTHNAATAPLRVLDHDRLTASANRRIVRLETLAEDVLRELVPVPGPGPYTDALPESIVEDWMTRFREALRREYADDRVVGLKTVICYRTGLDISAASATVEPDWYGILGLWARADDFRLQDADINGWVVHEACRLIAGSAKRKPLQFHTGFGDNDLGLREANPAYAQTHAAPAGAQCRSGGREHR